MAYTILQLDRSEGERAMITFTSKTRVGLNEEIDRFIKEKQPGRLSAVSRGLAPGYHQQGGTDEPLWYLRMRFD